VFEGGGGSAVGGYEDAIYISVMREIWILVAMPGEGEWCDR
jgi:hypothetical protein